MEAKIIPVEIKGVQRNVSPIAAPDGTCQDIVNLRPKDGAWRPVLPKEVLYEGNFSEAVPVYKELFVHNSLPENEYIARYHGATTERFEHIEKGATTFDSKQIILSYTKANESFKSLVCINDMVVISTTKNTYFHLYKDGAYIINQSINDLPDIKIAAGNHDQNKYDEIANQTTSWAAALVNFLEYRRDQADTHKRYNGHIGLIAAYRMSDGTIIKHSAPILHLAGAANDEYSEIIKPFEHGLNKRIIGLTVSKVKYYIKEGIPEGWGSVIDSIDIYACRIPLTDEIDVEVLIDNIQQYDPHVPFTDVDAAFTNKLFNKIDSVKLSEFEATGGSIPIEREADIDLANLETKEALTPDQLSIHQLGFKKGNIYNGRIHAVNIDNILFPGHHFDLHHLTWQKTNNDYLVKRSLQEIETNDIFTGYSVIDADNFLAYRVWIDTGSGEEEVSIKMPADAKMLQRNFTGPSDKVILLNKIITYPHPRAKRFDITLHDSGNPTVLIYKGEFQKHEMYSFAYHIFKRYPSDDYWPGHFQATKGRFEFVMTGSPPKSSVGSLAEHLAFVFTLFDDVPTTDSRIYYAVWSEDANIGSSAKTSIGYYLTQQGYNIGSYPDYGAGDYTEHIWIPLYSAEHHINGFENHIDIGNRIINSDAVLQASHENISAEDKTILRARLESATYNMLNVHVRSDSDFVVSCEAIDYEEDSSVAVAGTGYAYYPGYLNSKTYSETASVPDINNIIIIKDPNRLQLSEVENPFVWPVRNSYRIGDDKANEILDLAVQASPTSEGQFGEYPLIVFANNGIYLVDQGKDVVYSNIINISRLKANAGVLGIDGAVIFTTKDGLFYLQGREVKELNRHLISNITYNTQDTETEENPHGSTSGGLDFLQDAVFGWDNQHREILITKSGETYHYRFNPELGIFFIASGYYDGFVINSGKYQGYKITGSSPNHLKIYDMDEDDGTDDQVRVYFKTNPQLLTAQDFKKILRLIFRADATTDNYYGYLNLFVFGGNIVDGNFVVMQKREVDAGKHVVHLITGRTPVSCRYWVFMVSGKIENDAVFQHFETEVVPVLGGRLR